MAAADALEVRVGPHGRIVLPAELRRQLGIDEGSVLLAKVERNRLVLETPQAAPERLQALFTHIPREVSLVDELIAERRENARREIVTIR